MSQEQYILNQIARSPRYHGLTCFSYNQTQFIEIPEYDKFSFQLYTLDFSDRHTHNESLKIPEWETLFQSALLSFIIRNHMNIGKYIPHQRDIYPISFQKNIKSDNLFIIRQEIDHKAFDLAVAFLTANI